MGEAFRGLTIKFGADATQLDAALTAMSKSIRATEGHLRNLQKAMKMDPSSMAALSQRLTETQHKIEGLSSKAVVLGEKIRRIEGDKEFRAMAAQTSNFAAKAADAQLALARVEDRMAYLNDEFIKYREANDAAWKAGERTREQATAEAREFAAMHTLDNERLFEQLVSYKALEEQMKKYLATLNTARKGVDWQKHKADLAAVVAEEAKLIRETQKLAYEQGVGSRSAKAVYESKRALEATGEAAKALDEELKGVNEALTTLGRDKGLQKNRISIILEQAKVARVRVAELKSAIGRLESSGADTAGKSMMELQAETRKATEEYDRLAKAQAELAGKARAAAQELARVRTEAALDPDMDVTAYVAQLEKAESELRIMTARAREAGAALDTARSNQELRQMQGELRRTEAVAGSLRSQLAGATGINATNLRSLGVSMSATITPAIMIAGSAAVRSAEDIDSAFRDMKKTVDGTEDQFKRLRDAAIEYSKVHVTSADTILEIQAMGGQLGIAVEDLEAFATTVSNLDIATNMNADDIAVSLGKLGSVLGLTADEYDNFGDALVRLGNNMPALEGDVMNITTRWAGMGKIVGMSADQILAWSTAATATGQKAEAAGSAMMRMVGNIETAVSAGGKKLDEYARVAGMTSEQFRDLFRQDASAAMYAFIDGLGRMQTAGASVNQELAKLGIANVRDKQLIEGLAQQMANAGEGASILSESLMMSRDAFNGISDAWGDAGDAAREAEKKSEGFSGALGKLRNTAAALGDTVGQTLVPYMDQLSGMLGIVDKWLRTLDPETAKMLVSVIGLGAAIGPVLNVVASASRVFGGFTTGLRTAITAIKGGVAAAGGLKAAFAAMGGPVKLIATVLLTAAIPAITKFVTEAMEASERAASQKAAFDAAATAADGYAGALMRASSAQADASDGGSLADTVDSAVERLRADAEALTSIYDDTAKQVLGADARASVAQGYLDTMNELAGNVGDNAEGMARLKAAVNGYNAVTGASVTITDQYSGALSETAESMGQLIEAMKSRAKVNAYENQLTGLYESKIQLKQDAEEAYAAWKSANDELEAKIQRELEEHVSKPDQIELYTSIADVKVGADKRGTAEWQAVYDEQVAAWERALRKQYSGEAEHVNTLYNTAMSLTTAYADVETSINQTTAAIEAEGYAVDTTNGTVKAADQEMQDYVTSMMSQIDTMDEGAISAEAVAQSMEDMGIVLAGLQGLSADDQLAFIEALAENGGDVEAACEAIGISLSDLGVEAEDAFERMARGSMHVDDLKGSLVELSKRAPDTAGAIDRAFAAFESGEATAAETTQAVEQALNDAGIAIEGFNAEMVAMVYASTTTGEEAVAAFQAVADAAAQAKLEAKQLEEAKKTIKDLADSMDKVTDSAPALGKAMALAGIDAHELAWMLESAGMSVDKFGAIWEHVSSITSLTSPFQMKKRGEATTTGTIQSNLESQLKAAQLYEKAMTSLWSQVTDASEMAYVEALGNLSMDDLLTILWQAGMDEEGNVELPDVEFHANAQLFADVNDAEAQAALNTTLAQLQKSMELGVQDATFHYDEAMQQFVVTTEDGYQAVITGLDLVNGEVVATLDNGTTQVIAQAEDVPQDVADAITANAGDAADGGSAVANALVGAMGDLNAEMEERGRLAAMNMAYGFDSADLSSQLTTGAADMLLGGSDDSSLEQAGAGIAAAVASGVASADLSQVEQAGLMVAARLAAGMWSGRDGVETVAGQLLAAITAGLAGDGAEGGGAYGLGESVGGDLEGGLSSKTEAVGQAADGLRSAIVTPLSNINTGDGVSFYGQAQAIGTGLKSGMESKTEEVRTAAAGLASAVTDPFSGLTSEESGFYMTGFIAGADLALGLGGAQLGVDTAAGNLAKSVKGSLGGLASAEGPMHAIGLSIVQRLTGGIEDADTSDLAGKGEGWGQDIADGVSSKKSEMTNSANELVGGLAAGLSLLGESMNGIGSNASGELKKGLDSNFENVRSSGTGLAEAVKTEIAVLTNPATGLYIKGLNAGGDLGRGLGNAKGTVQINANELAAVVGVEFFNLQSSSWQWGKNAGDNFGAGLLASRAAVAAAAESVAGAAADPLHHSTPKIGPLHGDDMWGSEMVESIAVGMRNRVSDVRRSAYEVADAAASVRRSGAASLGAGGGSETNYNIWFNGARVNDDAAMRAAVINVVSEAVRKGGN